MSLLPEDLSAEEFLGTYWQKSALYSEQSVASELPLIDAHELAWLATLPDVESRLVFTHRSSAASTFSSEDGPFSENDLQNLPRQDWTLLVQDVDKHLPEFRRWIEQVDFLPHWRIDDLMISIAAPGGSVGPHRDQYDVFLCQASGIRDWQLSRDHSHAMDEASPQLSLLKPFEQATTRCCRPGDVLYIPPGLPHWGVARDFCSTYSIGFRAPSRSELLSSAARMHEDSSTTVVGPDDSDSEIFYTDSDLRLCEAQGCRISAATIERVRDVLPELADWRADELVTILGVTVTDPKHWLDPARPTAADVESIMQAGSPLVIHGMARFAWYGDDASCLVFLNGETFRAAPDCARFVADIAAGQLSGRGQIHEIAKETEHRRLLKWLLAHGAFDLFQGTNENGSQSAC